MSFRCENGHADEMLPGRCRTCDLEAKLAACEKALRESEAEAAGIRVSIIRLRTLLESSGIKMTADVPVFLEYEAACKDVVEALASDAGRKLLEELERKTKALEDIATGFGDYHDEGAMAMRVHAEKALGGE